MNRRITVGIAVFLVAGVALASWYDDYDAGFKAVGRGDWAVVIEKMTSAIKGNAKENNNARTYGNIFINYHPYYYRGYAYLRTGKYEQAISDFEKTSGPGELDRGTTEALMLEAKTKQAAANTGPPPPPPPTGPVIDPALKQQLNAAIEAANQGLAAARDRKAGSSPKYDQAVNELAKANDRASNAKTNEDVRTAMGYAANAKLYAESAQPPVAPPPVTVTVPPTLPPPTTTGLGLKPFPPVFSEYQQQLRRALENYYDGEFEAAARDFKSLSVKLPTNGWIWAFLGASQYSYYAFEADETYKDAAMESFAKPSGTVSANAAFPRSTSRSGFGEYSRAQAEFRPSPCPLPAVRGEGSRAIAFSEFVVAAVHPAAPGAVHPAATTTTTGAGGLVATAGHHSSDGGTDRTGGITHLLDHAADHALLARSGRRGAFRAALAGR